MPDEDDLHPSPFPGGTPPRPSPNPADRVAALEARVQHLEQRLETLEQQRSHPASPTPAPSRTPTPPPPAPRPQPSAPAFSQPTPAPSASLEDRLGSQVFNRIGIIAVLLGATLFLKLAADNHWIGPLGRVLIGLLAGAGLILWAERFRRRRFVAFAYSLQAIGSGTLYLSLWAAFQLYHLLPAPAAFALMLAVTAWNAFMALSPGDPSQASELLAVYALAGAFATPLLLSTGGNHPTFLFTYLLATDLATVALVRLRQRPAATLAAPTAKPWPRLLLIALPATALYFLAWYLRFYAPDQLLTASLFLTLFFAVFLTVPLAFRSKEGQPERSAPQQPAQESDHEPDTTTLPFLSDIVLPLANAAFTSLALYSVLEDAHHHAFLPWAALLLAALYLALLRLPQRPAARAIHLSLAVVFLTVAIPLKVSGAAISLAWLAEAVTLLWAAHRFESQATPQPRTTTTTPTTPDPLPRLLTLLASGALTLGLLGLLLHPLWLSPDPTTAFLNRRFATALAGILAFAAAAYIARAAALRQPTAISEKSRPAWREIAASAVIALNLIALQSGVLEIQTFWLSTPTATSAPISEAQLQTALSISAFLALYGAALLALGFRRPSAFLRWQGLILLLLAIAKTFLYDVRSLSEGYRVASLLGLGALLMAISFAYQRDWLSLRDDHDDHTPPPKTSVSD